MLLSREEWMDLRAYRALREAGATWAEIARETGHDWRTVKKYLSPDAPDRPPAVTLADQGISRSAITRTRDHAAW